MLATQSMDVDMLDMDLFDVDSTASTAASQTQQALVESHHQMGMMLDIMPIGLLVHTSQGIIYANRAASRVLDMDQQAAVGAHVLDFIVSPDPVALYASIQSAFNASEPLEFDATLRSSNGAERLVKFIVAALPWPGNPVIQILMQDITEQKQAEQLLHRLTITDELTGAYNRRHVTQEADLYVSDADGEAEALSVILLDVDHFKTINDRFGHQMGDNVLKELTQVSIQTLEEVRQGRPASFARFGGEEFLVLLPATGVEEAAEIAEQLRRAIASARVEHRGEVVSMSASFGVATYRPCDAGVDRLLARVDAALYQSKKNGRDRVSIAP